MFILQEPKETKKNCRTWKYQVHNLWYMCFVSHFHSIQSTMIHERELACWNGSMNCSLSIFIVLIFKHLNTRSTILPRNFFFTLDFRLYPSGDRKYRYFLSNICLAVFFIAINISNIYSAYLYIINHMEIDFLTCNWYESGVNFNRKTFIIYIEQNECAHETKEREKEKLRTHFGMTLLKSKLFFRRLQRKVERALLL